MVRTRCSVGDRMLRMTSCFPICDQAQTFYGAQPLAPVCQKRPASSSSQGWYIMAGVVIPLTALLFPKALI